MVKYTSPTRSPFGTVPGAPGNSCSCPLRTLPEETIFHLRRRCVEIHGASTVWQLRRFCHDACRRHNKNREGSANHDGTEPFSWEDNKLWRYPQQERHTYNASMNPTLVQEPASTPAAWPSPRLLNQLFRGVHASLASVCQKKKLRSMWLGSGAGVSHGSVAICSCLAAGHHYMTTRHIWYPGPKDSTEATTKNISTLCCSKWFIARHWFEFKLHPSCWQVIYWKWNTVGK